MDTTRIEDLASEVKSGQTDNLDELFDGLVDLGGPEAADRAFRDIVDTAILRDNLPDPGLDSLRYSRNYWTSSVNTRREIGALIQTTRRDNQSLIGVPKDNVALLMGEDLSVSRQVSMIPCNDDLNYLMAVLEKNGIEYQPVFDEFFPEWHTHYSVEQPFTLQGINLRNENPNMTFEITGNHIRLIYREIGVTNREGYREGIRVRDEKNGGHKTLGWMEESYVLLDLDLDSEHAKWIHVTYDDVLGVVQRLRDYETIDAIPLELRKNRQKAYLGITDDSLREEVMAALLGKNEFGTELTGSYQEFPGISYYPVDNGISMFDRVCTSVYVQLDAYARGLNQDSTPYDAILATMKTHVRRHIQIINDQRVKRILETVKPSFESNPFSGHH